MAAPCPLTIAFDRGTIRIEGTRDDVALRALPGVLWDPRVGAWRAPASRWSALCAALAEFRPVEAARAMLPPPPAMAQGELRPYQEAALCAWEAAGRRGVVVLPTGSGKTQVAIAAIARLGRPALCLAPTRVLVEQWVHVLTGAGAAPVGVYGDGRREAAPVTVATFESAWRHMDELGERFDLVVVDEAHHFGNGCRDEALDMCAASARLGLTATPLDGEAADRLAMLVGPVVYELGVRDLAGTWLADFDLYPLHLDLTRGEREAYEARMVAFRRVHARWRTDVPEGTWEDFARWAARSPEGRRALAAVGEARRIAAWTEAKRAVVGSLLARLSERRVLVFTADNAAAYAVAREHLVMPITCDIARGERATALDRFRRGELRALVSARVLNEGLDVPDADAAIVVGGAHGRREHVQRIGRVLRPAPGKRAVVYELVSRGTIEAAQARARRRDVAA